MRVLKLSGNELGISNDGGERVVEVVGAATSELPDALETLRLTQLLLDLTLLPQVADHAQDRRTAIKFDTLTTDQNRDGCAVPPQQLELRPRNGLTGRNRLQTDEAPWSVMGDQNLDRTLSDEFLGRAPDQTRQSWVRVHPAPVDDQTDPIRQVLHQRAQSLLAGAQVLLPKLPLGDVQPGNQNGEFA